ncbi:hypothetical protein T11_5300 [Trichinella zimbabwensis]|uniref:Uncharacterized protein n=1 Tax=Trichinella zimbabwensis TaxID=268475 RepID=A0A0V1G7Z6_9BILA|nr:hypothetical protein T11_5300 [Trichinella zimbabwensis]
MYNHGWSERKIGKIKFFCKPETFSENRQAKPEKYFDANI